MKRRLTTTVTSKGQVTIPAWIARRLRITPGARLTVEVKGPHEFVATMARSSQPAQEAADV